MQNKKQLLPSPSGILLMGLLILLLAGCTDYINSKEYDQVRFHLNSAGFEKRPERVHLLYKYYPAFKNSNSDTVYFSLALVFDFQEQDSFLVLSPCDNNEWFKENTRQETHISNGSKVKLDDKVLMVSSEFKKLSHYPKVLGTLRKINECGTTHSLFN